MLFITESSPGLYFLVTLFSSACVDHKIYSLVRVLTIK